jgi:hypothetical protein
MKEEEGGERRGRRPTFASPVQLAVYDIIHSSTNFRIEGEERERREEGGEEGGGRRGGRREEGGEEGREEEGGLPSPLLSSSQFTTSCTPVHIV